MKRRKREVYFLQPPGAPEPLLEEVKGRVRFEEVDSLSMVWHGRYPSYFEDGRVAFGRRYGLGYLDMYSQGFVAPIVEINIIYHEPLTLFEEFTVQARLHWCEAARLQFSYRILSARGRIAATGYTVQLFTNLEKEIFFLRPPFMEDFWQRWADGGMGE